MSALKPSIDYSQSQLETVAEDDGFVDRIFFSDEALFHLDGAVNRHNCRYW